MVSESGELIQGKRVRDFLLDQIKSRRLGRLVIPNSPHEWISLLLKIEKIGEEDLLLIDGVPGFEAAILSSPSTQILFEFLESDGVPCQFRTLVYGVSQKEIWVKLPKEVLRNQRRAHFRIGAPEGAEINFSIPSGQTIKAALRDYSMGGLSFYSNENLGLGIGDVLERVILRLPQGSDWISVEISRIVLIRWERGSWGGTPIWAGQILEVTETMKEKLRENIFINQRDLIRRVKKIPMFKSFGFRRI
jgi:c-di-GMP-binding flagellar brake protein YcgR